MTRVGLALLALLTALPASAQQLSLDIRDGLVTLSASNVPVRQILAEWAKVGGTRIVGGERVNGAPLTLQLERVPEAKALDIVLRGAAGYMAAARSGAPGAAALSIYDRIVVLATSSPPAGGGSPAAAARPPQNRFGVPPAVEPAEAEAVVDSSDTGAMNEGDGQPQVNPFANAFSQPNGAAPFGQPVQQPFGQPAQGIFGQPSPPVFPQGGGLFQPLQPAPGATAPSGFFGIPGSATPGVIQPPPQPGAPGVRPRS